MFTTILTLGQFIFCLGGVKNKFWLMLLGRAVFGLGGECMSVAQSAIISQWFKGKELGFALGLNLTVARLASVVGGIIIPLMIAADGDRVDTVMWFGTGLCCFSLIAGILLVAIDSYAEKKDGGRMEIAAEDKF
jgi:MFS family permease